MNISLNHLVFDHSELERFGEVDLSTLEELSTVVLVRNHPWDLSLKVLRRQDPFKPGPNIDWRDQVFAAADTMMGLVLRDHLEEGIVNFPVTVDRGFPAPCTVTFEIRLTAHAERDVRVAPPVPPVQQPAPPAPPVVEPPRAPAPPQANNTYRPPVNAQPQHRPQQNVPRPQNQLRRP